jgi:hypothetical protein
MISDCDGRQGHEKFKEFCALAGSGALTSSEWRELKDHFQHCEECREVFLQYLVLTTQGMPTLAVAYADRQEQGSWDDSATRKRLFARVRADQRPAFDHGDHPPAAVQGRPSKLTAKSFVQVGIAACLVVAVGFGAYRLGGSTKLPSAPAVLSPENSFQKLAAEKQAVEELLAAEASKIARLQEESSQKEQELGKLRAALRALGDHSSELVAANNQSEEQLQAVSRQRDALNAQLQDSGQAYRSVRAELASLRAERDKALLRTTSLEARIDELTAMNQEQEGRLKESAQYLTSDRDIRELMGARKLYIADVFDVDSGSRTRKPFGRVFYTQGKSLIFYAFDLDRQPGFVNASTFQVWGQKETAQGEQVRPMNLGILYMDNESNRRWVMRFDDPKQLAQIDAVFVTVEPHGGSQKPTSKPFLYALLRNEVNHP